MLINDLPELYKNSCYVNESHKDLVLATDILPISLQLQLQDLLLLDKCINSAYDFDGSDYVNLKDPGRDLRSDNDIVFKHKKPRLFKCGQNFSEHSALNSETD